MQVKISAPAEVDLVDIALFIARDDVDRAFSFSRELRQSCDGLHEFWKRYPVLLHVGGFDVRRRVHGNYLILSQVESNCVLVLRVVNSAMDIDKLFP